MSRAGLLTLVFAVLMPLTTAWAQKVEIFTDSDYALSNMQVFKRMRIVPVRYQLDAVDVLEQELSAGLPSVEVQARKMMEQRIAKIGLENLQQRASESYQPIFLAYRYTLTHFPAIVFNDGEAVIYGLTDMNAVMRRYHKWKRAHR